MNRLALKSDSFELIDLFESSFRCSQNVLPPEVLKVPPFFYIISSSFLLIILIALFITVLLKRYTIVSYFFPNLTLTLTFLKNSCTA